MQFALEKGLAVLQGFPKLRNVRLYGPTVNNKGAVLSKGAKDLRVRNRCSHSRHQAEGSPFIGVMANLT